MGEYYFERTRRQFVANRRIDHGYSHNIHFHNGYEIYILNKGDTVFNFEYVSFQMTHGSMIVIPPNLPHSSVCNSDALYDRIVISMREEFVRSLCTENTDLLDCFAVQKDCMKYTTTLDDDQLAKIMKLQQLLDDNVQNDLFGNDVLYRAHAAELLVCVNRAMKYNHAMVKNTMPEIIFKIISYVIRHYKEGVSMTDLSNELHMSSAYISRLFKSHMGISLREYIVQKKVTNACSLLMMGENVTDACYSSGFRDYANFIRTFKNITGITPGEYAKKSFDATI